MRKTLIALSLSLAFLLPALAQDHWFAPGNQNVSGQVTMCLNTAQQAVPQTGAAPCGGTQLSGNATGSTSAVTGTLTSAAGKTAYICGWSVSATGGTASVGPVTVAGLLGGSQVYQISNNAASTATNFTQNYNPCLPASAVNTNITVTTTANGTATAVDVNSWGYLL